MPATIRLSLLILLCLACTQSGPAMQERTRQRGPRKAQETVQPLPPGDSSSCSAENGELVETEGNPSIRFLVAAFPPDPGLQGILYFSRERIRFEHFTPPTSRGKGFEFPRTQLKSAEYSTLALRNRVVGGAYLDFRKGGVALFVRLSCAHGLLEIIPAKDPSLYQDILEAANNFEAALARFSAGGGAADRMAAHLESLRRKPTDPPPTGLFQLETEISFNVLDAVVFDPATGRISLLGHRDPRYLGTPIPYLQHLAALLENSRPSFTLNWTPDSEQRVDRFLASTWSPADQQRWADEWGTLFDARGELTPAGRYMLPALGATPTRNGNAPGWLGVTLTPTAGVGLQVTSVAPASPAERAGIRVNDQIIELNGLATLPPEEFIREIRYLGAGAACDLSVFRPPSTNFVYISPTLAADPGDPWQGLTRNDAAAGVFRAGSNSKAADVTFWVGVATRLNDTPAFEPAFMRLLSALGLKQMWDDYGDRIYRGQIDKSEAILIMMRAIAESLDDTYRLADQPVLRRLNQTLPRVADPLMALGEALGEFDKHSKAALGNALDRIWSRPGGILIPPELVASSIGVRPEVSPEYIGVKPDSQLARVMFDADYLGKRLVNMPALARKFPAYQTQVAFNQTHPSARRSEAAYRMWISVAQMDVAQSPDGNTLETRGARMQFNLRELTAAGRNLPPEPGSYGELLTSLYDALSQEFPALHELREAAKLAAAAEWLKSRRPDISLPAGGLSSWNGPARLPGIIFIYLHQPTAGSRMNTTVIASGGVALEPFPPGPAKDLIPVDSSVVDLRDIAQPPAAAPGVEAGGPNPTVSLPAYDNQALRKVLRREIVVPDYHPPGWFARATHGQTKGKLFTEALSVLARAEGDPEERLQVSRKLEEARRLAHVLENVDNTLNLLTARNLEAQAEFERLTRDLARSNDQFVESAIGILTQGLDEAYGYLKSERTGQLPEFAAVADALGEAQSQLDGLKSKVDTIESLRTAAAGFSGEASLEKREAAIRALGGLTKDLLLNADPDALGPLGKILGPIAKAHGMAGKLEDVVGLGQSLVDMERSAWRLKTLDPQSEEYLRQITQIQEQTRKNLIDRIGTISNDSLVKKYLP